LNYVLLLVSDYDTNLSSSGRARTSCMKSVVVLTRADQNGLVCMTCVNAEVVWSFIDFRDSDKVLVLTLNVKLIGLGGLCGSLK